MPDLSIVDDDNGMKLTRSRASKPPLNTPISRMARQSGLDHQELCAWNPGERVQSLQRDSQAPNNVRTLLAAS
jgi:hypothetical protein